MYYDYFQIAVLILAGVLLVYGAITIFSLVRPSAPSELKGSTYECGLEAYGPSWVRFDMRFYAVALIFVIFDLEIALLFPWAAVFRELSLGGFGGLVVIEGLVFVLILFLGLIYVWAKGDFDWVKTFAKGESHFARMPLPTPYDGSALTAEQGAEQGDAQEPATGNTNNKDEA